VALSAQGITVAGLGLRVAFQAFLDQTWVLPDIEKGK
jgi:hypothetical protein